MGGAPLVAVQAPFVAVVGAGGVELDFTPIWGDKYADLVTGLVYIDAAFNRADGSNDYDSVAALLPRAPSLQPGDMASFATNRGTTRTILSFVNASRRSFKKRANGTRVTRSGLRGSPRRGRRRRYRADTFSSLRIRMKCCSRSRGSPRHYLPDRSPASVWAS